MSLVRAAWERRPEGPAYLFLSVMLLYLAGQCAFFCTHLPPWIRGTRRVFPEFLWISDLSPPAVISSERDPTVQEVRSLKKHFSWRYRTSPLPRSKTFMFLGVAGGTIERSCYSPHYVNTCQMSQVTQGANCPIRSFPLLPVGGAEKKSPKIESHK